jgi:hypothetical protein
MQVLRAPSAAVKPGNELETVDLGGTKSRVG